MAAVLWACACAHVLPARAEPPTVVVRAASRIELHAAHRNGEAHIRGALLDDLDQPLSGRRVALDVRDSRGAAVARRIASTAADGSFRVDLRLPVDHYTVHAEFAGSPHLGRAEREFEIDLARTPVTLRIMRPGPAVDLEQPRVRLAVRASSARGGEGLPIKIEDELGRPLARGRTGAAGIFERELASEALGPAGVGRLVVETPGDATRSSARTQSSLVRVRPTTLTLQAEASDGAALRLDGALRANDSGLGDKAIGLFDGSRHLGSVLTERDGSFTWRGPAAGVQADAGEELALQARFDSDAPWLGSSRSETLHVKLTPESAPGALLLLLPCAACLLLMWWMERGAEARRQEVATERGGDAPEVGIHAAPSRRLRPTLWNVAGEVRDAGQPRPISHADVELIADGGGHVITLHADADGAFDSGALEAGAWTLRVVAPGYAPSASRVTVPHRGEWSAACVRLESLRDAAVRAFEPAARAVLPAGAPLTQSTAREVLHRATRLNRAGELLRELTSRVERAAYGPTPPTRSDVERIARDAGETGGQIDRTDHDGSRA